MLYGPGEGITPRPGVFSLCLSYVRPLAISDCSSCRPQGESHEPSTSLRSEQLLSFLWPPILEGLGLPAGGAGPTGGRGSRASSGRGPHGPRAPGLALGEPVLGSNRICRRGAAGDAVCIQRIPVAVLATPAATSYLRALVVVCKDPGRSMSFTWTVL